MLGGEVFGFENVEFVRELDEGTQWPVMYMYYVVVPGPQGRERSRLEIHT